MEGGGGELLTNLNTLVWVKILNIFYGSKHVNVKLLTALGVSGKENGIVQTA